MTNNRKNIQNDSLRKKIESIIKLPALPTIVSKILQLIDNPRGTDVNTLSKLILSDQVLTTKILKVANSPFYGYAGQISTIQRAIVVIGFNEVKSILLSSSIMNMFKMDDRDFSYFKFWEHSVAVAIIMRMLSRTYYYMISGEAFVSGLIHDIGKIIIHQYLYTDFKEIMKKMREEGKSYLRAEREVLGVTHSEIGSWLLKKWNMPPNLINSVLYHHNPELAEEDKPLVAFVHFADYLVKRLKIGDSLNNEITISDSIWSIFEENGIDIVPEDIDLILERAKSEVDKTEGFISLLK